MPSTTLTLRGLKVRVMTQTTLPYLLRKQGITLGRTIRLRGHALGITPELLAHEMEHVLRWHEMGTVRFLLDYIKGVILFGYGLKHPHERAAYDFAVRYARTPEFIEACGELRRVA